MECYSTKCAIQNLIDRVLLYSDNEINEALKGLPEDKLGQLAFHVFVAEQDKQKEQEKTYE